MFTTDNEFIGRYLRQNDREAFEMLVRRHAGMVMSVCRSMLRHQQDAEDAFQATFLVLSRKICKLQNRNSISGWLYLAAVRNCLALRRKKYSSREDEMVNEPIGQSNEPWQNISDRQEIELVHRELNRLPEHYRNVILLYHVQGFSREQTAEMLDVTEPSVKASLARGRRLLRRRLVQQGIVMSVMISALCRISTSFGSEIDEPLLESTLELCTASGANAFGETSESSDIASATTGASNELVLKLAEEGMKTMTAISTTKIAAIATLAIAVLVTPFLIVAGEGGQPSAAHRPSLEIGVDDDVNSPARIDADHGVRVASSQKTAAGETASPSPNDNPDKLRKLNEQYWMMKERAIEMRIKALHSKTRQTKLDESSKAALQADIMDLEAERVMTQIRLSEAKIAMEKTIPPGSGELLQPGEVLLVEIEGSPEYGRRVTIQRDDTIVLPWLGAVSTKGKTLADLSKLIREEYAERVLFKDTDAIQVYRAISSEPLIRQ